MSHLYIWVMIKIIEAQKQKSQRKSEANTITRMEVTQVLHMNGGVGEASYANNSLVQV